jgi:hypothetical protein
LCREEISKSRLNRLRGLDNHERIDEELYADFETDDAKKVTTGGALNLCVASGGLGGGT